MRREDREVTDFEEIKQIKKASRNKLLAFLIRIFIFIRFNIIFQKMIFVPSVFS